MIRLKMNEVDRLERFSKFESVEEYQLHIELWVGKYKQDFTKSELVGFKWLMFFRRNPWGLQRSHWHHVKYDS
ncbi:hypothetical protein [Bacillus sp. 1NLA3E]|uniref:hypothetical protein n=1 Tax=Bacillus sp. 1NLA3E TaxID=666686 RepID=UPI000247E6B7|nr:hypothetical protein [Bacillus sp. 1NLA3E]AGK55909.1 hypothetical protein B1NLA3E_20855 [Bacillus sp. 1NLA3E]